MGSLAIAFLQQTPHTITMKYCSALLVLAFAAYAHAGQWVYVEDPAEYHPLSRRAAQEEAPLRYPIAPPPPVPAYEQGPKGRVGPVYPFVKTDPKANFKWGVRHVAGVQYGKYELIGLGFEDLLEGLDWDDTFVVFVEEFE